MEKLATLSDLAAYKALSEKQNAVQLKLITDKIDELAYRLVCGKVEFCKTHSYLLEDEEYNPATLEPRAYNADEVTYLELDPAVTTLTFYPNSDAGDATYWPLSKSSSSDTIADYPITDTGSVRMSAVQQGFKGSDTLAVTPIDYIEPEVGTLHLTLNSVPTIADLKGLIKHYTINDHDFPVSEKDWQSKITIVGTEGGNETAAAAWWTAYQDAIAEDSNHPTLLYSSTTDLAPLTSDPFKLKCTYVTDGKREITVLIPLEFVEDKEDLASESIAQITIVGKNLNDKDVTFDSANTTSNLLKFANDKSTTIPLTLSTIKLTYNQQENDTTGEIELTKANDDTYSFVYDNVNYDLAISHVDFAKATSIRDTTNTSIAFTISSNGKRLTSFFQTVELQKANVINVVNKQFFYFYTNGDLTSAIDSDTYSRIENYFITVAAQNGHIYLLSNEAAANANAYCISTAVISQDDLKIDEENCLITQIEVQINDTDVSLQADIKSSAANKTILLVDNVSFNKINATADWNLTYKDTTTTKDITVEDASYKVESISMSVTFIDSARNAEFATITASASISNFKTAVIQQMAAVSNRILNATLFSYNGTDGKSVADLTSYNSTTDQLSYDLYSVSNSSTSDSSLLTLDRSSIHSITIAVPATNSDDTNTNGIIVDAYSLLKSKANSYAFYLKDKNDNFMQISVDKNSSSNVLSATVKKCQLKLKESYTTGYSITGNDSSTEVTITNVTKNPSDYKIDNNSLTSFIKVGDTEYLIALAGNQLYVGESLSLMYKVSLSYLSIDAGANNNLTLAEKTSAATSLASLALPSTDQSYLQMSTTNQSNSDVLDGKTISLVTKSST